MYPEKLRTVTRPCLQWVDLTHLVVTAHLPDLLYSPLTAPEGRAHFELPDGRRYELDSLTLDATVVGEGGLDGAIAATAFVYVYLVPSENAPGQLAVIGSDHDPLDGGPATLNGAQYSSWIYAGSARYDVAAGGFTAFRYQGEGYYRYVEPVQIIDEAAADDAAPVAVDLVAGAIAAIPQYTFGADLIIRSILTLGGAAGIRANLWAGIDAGITAPTWAPLASYTMLADTIETCALALAPANPTGASPWVWYQREDIAVGSTATFDVFVSGYKDSLMM